MDILNNNQPKMNASTPDLSLTQILNKKWDECTDAERIVKLREEARQMQYMVNRVVALEAQVRALELHSHADGKVVVPVSNNQGSGLGMVGASRQNLLG